MQVKTTSNIVSRPYRFPDDFWKVHKLLIETYPITPTGFNWEIRRWEGWHFHNVPEEVASRADQARIWETEAGQVVGAVHPEGSGDFCLEIHPAYRHRIEEDMIAWAEDNLAAPHEDGQRVICELYDYDLTRRLLLEQRGYTQTDYTFVMRRLRCGLAPLPALNTPEGYTLRTTRPEPSEYDAVAALLNAAFNRDFHQGAEVGHFMTKSPSFRHDLDFVAEAPDGTLAAYVSLTYEPHNRYGIFEPVCTHPAHQRRGLARALMSLGLHKMAEIGAADVYVGTGNQRVANLFYDSMGFPEVYTGHIWQKLG